MERRRFETTRWSLVDRARGGRDPEALNELLERLWSPIYWWIRRSGRSHLEAEDLTQRFVETVVLRRGLLEKASPERGRLRSLVLSSLKRFLIDEHRVELARKRQAPDGVAETSDADAHAAFERQWNAAILSAAMNRTRRRLEQAGRDGHWRAFELRVLSPATTGSSAPSLEEVAEQCGFATTNLAAAAVQHVRKKALSALREVVYESALPGEAEEEYRSLVRSLTS